MSVAARKGHVTRAMHRVDSALVNAQNILSQSDIDHSQIDQVRQGILQHNTAICELEDGLQNLDKKRDSLYADLDRLDGEDQDEALKRMENMENDLEKLTLPAERACHQLKGQVQLLNKELEFLFSGPSHAPTVFTPVASAVFPQSIIPSSATVISADPPTASTFVSAPATMPPVASTTVSASHVPQHAPYPVIYSPAPVQARLPSIELPKFNGDIFKWATFWEHFQDLIHNRPELTDSQRMYYLISCLQGPARSTLANLAPTSANYLSAITLLKERFGGEETIKIANYRALEDLPRISCVDVKKLRAFFDKMEGHFRSLISLGENVDQSFYKSLIQRKLPYEVQSDLFDKESAADNVWTMSEFRIALRKYITKKEVLAGQWSEPKPQKFSDTRAQQRRTLQTSGAQPWSSADGLSASEQLVNSDARSSTSEQPRKFSCIYCSGEHWPTDCSVHKTALERRKQIKGRCLVCLKDNHQKVDCRWKKACVFCKAVGSHHKSLCFKQFPDNTKGSQSSKTQTVNCQAQKSPDSSLPTVETMSSNHRTDETDSDSALLATGQTVVMQTALATVSNGKKCCQVRILFDTGSTRTWCSEHLASKLCLKRGKPEKIDVSTFGSGKHTVSSPTSELTLLVPDGPMKITVNIISRLVDGVTRTAVSPDEAILLRKYSPLADKLITTDERVPIDLLVGSDYYTDLLNGQMLTLQDGLHVISSKLGWIVAGRSRHSKEMFCREDTSVSCLVQTALSESDINFANDTVANAVLNPPPDIERFWDLESLGIKDCPTENDDDRALKNFNATVIQENGRYQVTLPWRDEGLRPPDNFKLAEGRLRSLIKRLKLQPEHFLRYDEIIQEQLEKGVIELVPDPQVQSGTTHYLPHHAVLRPDKETTKIRVVYDGSAKSRQDQYSLNECLHRGQVFAKDLISLLLRFRLGTIGVTADIEKAFLQVGLQLADRDMTRFLWLKDPSKMCIEDNLQTYRFCRIPFGLVSSPFLLGATVKYHLQRCRSPTASLLAANIYVDNVLLSISGTHDAQPLYKEAKAIFFSAGMNLRQWGSNSQAFTQTVAEADRETANCVKALGLQWDLKSDMLSLPCKIPHVVDDHRRRDVLAVIASVFDPIGFFGPALFKAKVFLQSLAARHADWDEPLTPDEFNIWRPIITELSYISAQQIPRHIGIPGASPEAQQDLLCFCDASEQSYATVLYIRHFDKSDVNVDLVFSKSRLAPLNKAMSIPRLELMGVISGVRAIQFVKESLQIQLRSVHLWTDSQCVLQWITTSRPLTVFVENRIREIKSHRNIVFHHVSSAENPADIPTRGMTVTDLMSSHLWWHGPDWLMETPDDWPPCDPKSPDDTNSVYECEMKPIKHSQMKSAEVMISADLAAAAEDILTGVAGIAAEHFSNLTRLLRVTAWVLRFCNQIKKKKGSRDFQTAELTSAEFQHARMLWFKAMQDQYFPEIMQHLQKGRLKPPLAKQLGIQLDQDGLMRCHGRIGRSDLSQAAVTPVLLPRNCHFTRLMVEHAHRKIKHFGITFTLAKLRQEVWIPKGRLEVGRILRDCRTCRKVEGSSFKLPDVPPLPSCRVRPSEPFTFVGLDYLGPLLVRHAGKIWICLFTCLSIRAIHLEVVCDLSSKQFLMALGRFISRRGRPKMITLDNATHFKLGKEVFDRAWAEVTNDPQVAQFMTSEAVQWKFIPEHAPWHGGFYERLVGLTKRALRKSIGRNLLTYTELVTIVTEVEGVINDRPLTYVSEDLNSHTVLTPAHFLGTNRRGRTLPLEGQQPDPEYLPDVDSAKQLIDSWKERQSLVNKFWSIWVDEYLLALRERHVSVHQSRSHAPVDPAVGHVVLVKSDAPRLMWKIGRITELVKSSDGEIRSAFVHTPSGSVLKRSIAHLYPLELGLPLEPDLQGYPDAVAAQGARRAESKRSAARVARQRIRVMSHE